MTAEFTVGAAWIQLLLDALSAAGFDARGYCRRQGWDLDRLGEPQVRLPWSQTAALWQTAARYSGDPYLGLHAAASLPPRAQGPLGYLLMSSSTLLEGLSLMIRYQDLHFDGKALSFEDRGDHFSLCVSLPQSLHSTSHQIEYICALLKRTCAWVVGPAFRLLGVRFRHGGPASAAEHERMFECPVKFRQLENALLLPRDAVSRPSLFANAEILRGLQAIADRRLAEFRSPAWVLRVRTALESRLAGPCDIGDIARHLGVSRRSLQRKLAAEGSSFAKVLEEGRRDRSLELIRRQGMMVAAIASEVGFADSRAFTRAFKRWTGSSPSTYRTESHSAVGRDVAAPAARIEEEK